MFLWIAQLAHLHSRTAVLRPVHCHFRLLSRASAKIFVRFGDKLDDKSPQISYAKEHFALSGQSR
jgi:hypothetical protein